MHVLEALGSIGVPHRQHLILAMLLFIAFVSIYSDSILVSSILAEGASSIYRVGSKSTLSLFSGISRLSAFIKPECRV